MDLFLRTSRCRIPRQLLSYQYSRRCYATALASSSSTARPPLPTAHRAVPEQTRLPQKKVPPSTTSSSPASSSSDKHAQLKGSAVAFTTAKKIRKARVQQMETEQIQQTNAQMLQAVQELSAIEHLATFDVWAKPVENLDLYIPAWRDSRKGAGILDHLRVMWNTQKNLAKNVISMRRIAVEDGFPGVAVPRPLSLQLFKIQTTPWLEPFRKTALETYMELQRAVASGDEQVVKKLSVGAHHKRLLDLIRARDPSKVYVWSSDAPAQNEAKVVSIRAFEQNLSREPPKFGNRLTVQALVRFDTMQKLDVYSKRGQLLSSAEPKRVVEYLIFQKRMWYDVPWVVRDQLYESLQGNIKHLV